MVRIWASEIGDFLSAADTNKSAREELTYITSEKKKFLDSTNSWKKGKKAFGRLTVTYIISPSGTVSLSLSLSLI